MLPLRSKSTGHAIGRLNDWSLEAGILKNQRGAIPHNASSVTVPANDEEPFS
ncbi:hypothetical protein AB4Y89_12010 [Terriglobus sp. 2YAB30_2]|uniref:hypothetical protein n=1 Tax=unclassified Terriglobus TaxID=2628988 RepID=UPI003F9DD870